jgi:peptide/nickel transport system substrate-binding protein
MIRLVAFTCLAAAVLLAPARADNLTLALGAPITSLDPHFYNTSPNNDAAFHVFDRLVDRTAEGRLAPGLALSWRPTSDTSWEMKLRPGVTWHDGTPFTAADAVFTIRRAQNVPNNLGGYENLVRTIVSAEAPDALTLRLVTRTPTPNLPSDLSFIAVIAEHVGRTATTGDYNAGRMLVGTGPYKFVSYAQGDRLVLARNDAWWGPKQAWDQVTLRMIPNISNRTAALLAGDVDVIEAPSPADLPMLKGDGRVSLFAVPGGRVAYINPIYEPSAEAEPITTKDGKPIMPTPLRNLKVREALSAAINRDAIVERVLMGTATATGQWLPPGSYSYVQDIKPPAYDPVAARKLLAEAGYPDGFRMKLSTANDRTPFASEITQAVAQMWARIGVTTTVEGLPFAMYSSRGSKQQFSAYFGTLNNPSMEAGGLLRNLLMTVDPAAGNGTYNWSRYSNPALDTLIGQALGTVDEGKRERLLIEAERMVTRDVAFIPIYQFQNMWASRKRLAYDARADELTLAVGVHTAAAP